MRYLARRIRTGEWLSRDLPLSGVQRTRTLSGPSVLAATIEPELFRRQHNDGLRLLEGWGTMIYAVADDDSRITGHGIVIPPTSYDGPVTSITCAGISAYPQGYIYDTVTNFGPDDTKGLPRPDTIMLFRRLWAYMQSRDASDLGVEVTGPIESGQYVGDNDNPFRLAVWKGDDVGRAMNDLAAQTPFDYVEDVRWLDDSMREPKHEIRVGHPRLGRARNDLRFVTGENIIERPQIATPTLYANDVIGLGNGTGSTLVTARSTVDDGRLRRTLMVTDKTIKDEFRLRDLVTKLQATSSGDEVEITSIKVRDHDNARISSIEPGDDILIQAFIESFGQVRTWHRVLSVTTDENDYEATVNVQRSSSFIYNTTTMVGQANDA